MSAPITSQPGASAPPGLTAEEEEEFTKETLCLSKWWCFGTCCCLCTAGISYIGAWCYVKSYAKKWGEKMGNAIVTEAAKGNNYGS